MSFDEDATVPTEAEIVAEIANRVEAELPLLAEHLRMWLEAHRTAPRLVIASPDPEGTGRVQVWLVTDDAGADDGSSRVAYDPGPRMFGLLMKLQNGVLWYMGPYGSLVDTVDSI